MNTRMHILIPIITIQVVALLTLNISLRHLKISDKAKETAKKIFYVLAQAEGFVHGMTAHQVHFQEVGSDDSILDIITVAICLDFYILTISSAHLYTKAVDLQNVIMG